MAKKNLIGHLSKKEKDNFFEALYYMKMAELKSFCQKHAIPLQGKKGEILSRLKNYLLTGKINQPKSLPDISKAKPKKLYPLAINTKILKGAYKNDLTTRNFFKKLIGEHFHFTSFGQDWILNRWREGKPPTYGQFAKYWQKEFLQRQNSEVNPKQEWAYLNFIRQYKKQTPHLSKRNISLAWKKTQQTKAKIAEAILSKITRLPK